jgi:RND family efflux transporter MFP subunit
MAMHENEQSQTGTPEKPRRAGRNILRIVISLVLIAAGIGGARFLIATKPTVNKRVPAKMEPLVRTISLQPEKYTLNVSAMGTVIPAREISLESQVAGEVVYLHPEFTEGGMLPKGSKILEINRKDYELAVLQKKRALSDAEYAMKLELGHQDVARKEWDLLYGDQKTGEVESELALRKPHLEKVQMDITAAKAELEQANINLKRTTLTAPFNVLVLSRHVNLGSQVTSQERLADLVGTDSYWVQVSLPVEKLRWVRVPNGQGDSGSRARIIYRGDYVLEGRVVRLLPDLSKEGRMARLLLEVDDPLGMQAEDKKRPMLLIGEYVRVQIEGEELDNVYRIPRPALRNDNEVWLVDDKSKLVIQSVKTIWREEDSVVVQDGFKPGQHLLVSDLAAPVAGMPVRIESEDKKQQNSRSK